MTPSVLWWKIALLGAVVPTSYTWSPLSLRVGLPPLPEQAGEGKSGVPGLHPTENHLSESPGTQQQPP